MLMFAVQWERMDLKDRLVDYHVFSLNEQISCRLFKSGRILGRIIVEVASSSKDLLVGTWYPGDWGWHSWGALRNWIVNSVSLRLGLIWRNRSV